MAPINRAMSTPPLLASGSGVALPDRQRPCTASAESTATQLASQLSNTCISQGRAPSSSQLPSPMPARATPSSAARASVSQEGSFTPLSWQTCFDDATDVSLPSRNGVWRVYSAGFELDDDELPSLVVVLLHGGGHAALSWGLVASHLKSHVAVLAFDARGHGHSQAEQETCLDAETQVDDAVTLLVEFFRRARPDEALPRFVVCGHSMGGAIAIRIAASRRLPSIVGLIVIDVVEGTAMAALPHMSNWLADRLRSFASVERAIRYVNRAGFVRNPTSARLSVPPQVKFSEERRCWVWRTPLEQTEQYWKGWFRGLSSLFLSVPVAKLLLLANVNRLDKDLMIAQMQGKFQNMLISSAGHAIHEDQPEQTARALLDYLRRNLLIERDEDIDCTIFQQRKPIPPC